MTPSRVDFPFSEFYSFHWVQRFLVVLRKFSTPPALITPTKEKNKKQKMNLVIHITPHDAFPHRFFFFSDFLFLFFLQRFFGGSPENLKFSCTLRIVRGGLSLTSGFLSPQSRSIPLPSGLPSCAVRPIQLLPGSFHIYRNRLPLWHLHDS
jgi:hypothetical protein